MHAFHYKDVLRIVNEDQLVSFRCCLNEMSICSTLTECGSESEE